MQTYKEVKAIVKKHKGPIYMDALVKEDTWTMQVLKSDVLHFLSFELDSDEESPVYTSIHSVNPKALYLHRSY